MSTSDDSLYRACYRGDKRLVLVLANSDNVTYVDPDLGDTPLHRACTRPRGWLDIVEVLIEKCGCDPNVRTRNNQSVLHYACRYDDIDIVKYLIDKQHLDPLLRDSYQLEPLDHAINYDKTAIAVYLCQHCISSDEILNPNRIKTTVNLIKYILRVNPSDPKWKSANGDNILRLVGSSKTYISHNNMSSQIMSGILNSGDAKFFIVNPDYKTKDGDNLLELACQSAKFLSQTPSCLILKWLGEATINQVEIFIPDSKTADGDTLIQLVCQSEICISHISTAVLSKWLSYTTTMVQNLEKFITPEWKTADGNTLLQLVCQSETIVSRISSTVLTKWLSNPTTNLDIINFITTNWKTRDNYTLFTVLSRLLSNSGEISIDRMKMVDPNWKTLDDIHFLYILFHSKVEDKNIIELMQHYILKHGLNPDNTYLDSKGNTALHIACQANKLAVVSYLINQAHSDPNMKNKTGSMPLQLTSDSGIMKILVDHGAKMTKNVVFQLISSKHITDSGAIIELFTLSVRKGTMLWNPNDLNDDGCTALHLACQANNLSVVSYLINQAHCDPNIRNKTGNLPLDMTTNSEVINYLCQHNHVAVYSRTIVKWLNNLISIDDDSEALTLMVTILKSLADNHRYKTKDGSTLLHVVCTYNKDIFHAKIRLQLVDFLLTKCQCDPNCLDSKQLRPLQLTSDSEIMKTLIEHGAKMAKDVVFKLISSKHITESRAIELFTLSVRKGTMLWNPDDINNEGNTALHIACQVKKLAIVSYLIDQAHCDPNIRNKMVSLPIDMTTDPEVIDYVCQHDHVAVYSKTIVEWMNKLSSITDDATLLRILKSLVDNHKYKTKDGSTLLHVVCKFTAAKIKLVDFLLSECQCDPNCLDSKRCMPLQLTSDPTIMKTLIEYGAKMTTDVVFKLITSKYIVNSEIIELFTLSIRKETMIWNPSDLNNGGYTALKLACEFNKTAIVNFLLAEAKCDPNQVVGLLKSPLELTTNLEIAKRLIIHGAKVTPKLVIKFEAMEAIALKKKALINLMLTTWDPDDKGKDGYTALHLACKAGNPTTVNVLLSVARCNPNIKSNYDKEVPLQMTTNAEIIKDLIRHGANTSIMYDSYQDCLGTNKPVQPPVKVFIVGNPSVGKSTLTAALKKKIGVIARIFARKVTGIDQKTVGIVPHDLDSKKFGQVTLYDFAGHREFYSGHAALLQTAIQSTPPVFLLVVKVCEDSNEIIKNILYWISFLENQCDSVSCKPHFILVGSHADALKGVNPKDKIKTIIDSLDTEKYFINMRYIGFVTMNCQYHESTGMSDLRRLLIKSCEELRIHKPITFNAHCFLVFLIDTFMNQTAVTIKIISKKIQNQQSKVGVLEFLPKDFEMLYKICLELNDRGHILLLKDRIAIENSYIVIDKEFLLSDISGTVFAPEGFRQYKELSSNTGVVPLSKIVKSFPDKDINVLIGYLTHLEFCHEIFDQALLQRISKDCSQASKNERYYLFPGLISLEAETNMWETESHFNLHFGWISQCTNLAQFLTSRFLQVLLLRLAFSLALKSKCDDDDNTIGIHRKCSIWKNGIFWGREFGMETLVEVIEDRSVTVMARFQTSNLEKCIKHRSEVIRTVLECLNRFCPRVSTTESFIDASSPLKFPFALNSDKTLCTVQDLAQAIVGNCVSPSVVLSGSGKIMPAERFLSFEPYTEVEPLVLQELWDINNEDKIISDSFLSKFVRKTSLTKLNWFAKIFNDSADIPSNKDNLFQELLKWRGSEMSYKHFHQILDQYSVFAGRNVLDIAGYKCEASSVEEDKMQINSDQLSRLNVEGEVPQLHELQLLTFNNGRELRIMEIVAPKWKQVAIAIGFNKERIDAIEEDEHYKQEKATFEMFGRWLKGEHDLKPVTWDTLLQCLKQAKLPDIAEMLSNIHVGKDKDGTKTTFQQKRGGNERDISMDVDNKVHEKGHGGDGGVLQRDYGGSLPSLDIKALEVTEGRGGRKVRVIERIGSQWEEVAKALDMKQEDIDMIKTRHSDNDEEACHEMLAIWLEGNNGEVSWTAFSQALIDAGLPELADLLKAVLNVL